MAMTIGKYKRSANLLLLAALWLVSFSALTVHAAAVSIDDQAKVLDINKSSHFHHARSPK
jgi:hypothetical protein